MPNYTWYGIDLQGVIHRGNGQAYSHQQLEKELLHNDIALLSSKVTLPWSRLRRPSVDTIISFFDALATLLEAGIFLDEALLLLKKRHHHVGFKKLIDDVQFALHEGVSFSSALAPYKKLFGSCTIELIASGERVGTLPQSLRLVSRQYTDQAEFAKKVRAVTLLPAITFIFFLVVAFVILAYVVPVFASMFLSARKDLPWITNLMLQASAWCASSSLLWVGAVFIFGAFGAKKWLQKPNIKRIKDKYILYIPIFGNLFYKQTIYQFLQTTALLLGGGIHEVPALQAAAAGISNDYIRRQVYGVIKHVQSGKSLADALTLVSLGICPEAQAMVAVGEESGTLAAALDHGAQVYKHDVEKALQIISSLVQPCLMIVLGLLITVLIFSVYMPVLQLAYVIS